MFLYTDQLGSLEQQQVTTDVKEVIGALSNEQDDLSSTLHDWSYWDETYQFALDQNQDYITQNLDGKSLSAIRVNLFVVTDTQGNILYGTIVDPVTGSVTPIPDDFNQFLPPDHPFLNHTSLSGTNTGILILPMGPMMVASSPVLNNRGEGPSSGVLVMGRSLNTSAFARISRTTGNPISAHWNGDISADDLQVSLLKQMNPSSTVISIPRNDTIISGYTVISDVNGKKILIVTDLPRDIYQNGAELIRTYLVLFAFVILVTLFIVLFTIDKIVLKRLNYLTNRVRKIGQGHNDDMRPGLTGSDEISLLEQAILTAHTELKKSEQELMKFSTSLAIANKKLNILSQLTRKDLTNQIFILNSYLELVKIQLTGQDEIIDTLEKSATAARSIRETIEYSKDYQDMGRKPPVWQNVQTAMLLGLSHLSMENIRHSIETQNLEIYADPQLEKVCQRLFENSMMHGDHVTCIRVWCMATLDRVTILFEDDGRGIPQEKKEQIFLRDEGPRASIGNLIFVREILDITGITIRETGDPTKGARFEIGVPNGGWRRNPGSDQGQGGNE